MDELVKWEYKVMTTGGAFKRPADADLEAQLNALGEEGWKLVSVVSTDNSGKLTLVCRKPLTSVARRKRSMPSME